MCICVLKTILGLVNFIFFLIGLAIAAAGGILIWGAPLAQNLLSGLFSTLTKSIGAQVSLPEMVNYIFTYANSIGTVLLIVGLIIAAIGLCGMMGTCCCCTCCCNRIFLIIYVVATGIIFLAEIVLIIVIFAANTQIDSTAKSLLSGTLTGYNGTNITNAQTLIWNIVMVQMQCCGVNNGSDFTSIPTWNRTVSYNGYSMNITYPAVCCKMDTTTYQPKDITCPFNFTVINSNAASGCYNTLRSTVVGYGTYGIIGVGVVAGFNLLMIIFAIIIIQDISKVTPI